MCLKNHIQQLGKPKRFLSDSANAVSSHYGCDWLSYTLFHAKRQTSQVKAFQEADISPWSAPLGSVMDWQNIAVLLSLSKHSFCGTQAALRLGSVICLHPSVWNPFSSRASSNITTETLALDIPCLSELCYFDYNSFSTGGGDMAYRAYLKMTNLVEIHLFVKAQWI